MEPFDLVISACRLASTGQTADVGIRGGRIAALGDLAGVATRRRIEAGRRIVPGFVDAHVHLDKAYLLDRTPSREGTLAEAIRVTAEAKRGFTVEDVQARARRLLEAAIAAGTTAMRGHVEVDPIVGLRGVEAVLPLRAEYADRLDLQLCAFAQEGILKAPGTEALLREALRAGADLVGGCPYNDTDGPAHVDRVFALAREFACDVDFHADFADEPVHRHVDVIVDRTERHGWQGRVAIGHLTELAACDPTEQARIADGFAPPGPRSSPSRRPTSTSWAGRTCGTSAAGSRRSGGSWPPASRSRPRRTTFRMRSRPRATRTRSCSRSCSSSARTWVETLA